MSCVKNNNTIYWKITLIRYIVQCISMHIIHLAIAFQWYITKKFKKQHMFSLSTLVLLLMNQTALCSSLLSQFGLFRQPQTSFTRSRNRESFTTLRKASLRRKLDAFGGKSCLRALARKNRSAAQSRRGDSIRGSSIGDSNLCHIFLEERGVSRKRTHDSRFLQVEEEVERGFSLDQEDFASLMFLNVRLRKRAAKSAE